MKPQRTKSASLQPAASIIDKLGGEPVVCKLTGTAYTAPYRWQAPLEKGGTGGLIPQRYHRMMLDYARLNGIDLRAEDFLSVAQPDHTTPQPASAA